MASARITSFLIVLFFFGLSNGKASGQIVNLLSNPGFEQGQTAWTGWGGNVQVTQNDFYSGTQSAWFTGHGTLEQSPVSVEPGKTYKLSAWIKINDMQGNDWGGIRFSAIDYNWAEWHVSAFYTPQSRPVGEWFNEVVTFTAGTGQVRIQIGFFGGGGWTPDFLFDDIVLFEEVPVNEPPVIDALILNTQSGTVPFTVTGQIQAHDPDGVVENYIVDTGDGAVYAGSASFSHTYRVQGEYTLHVTVTDDKGATDTLTRLIVAEGTNNHTINITGPAVNNGQQYQTTQAEVDISGQRENGTGDIFWINTRTMQSGFAPVANGQFAIPAVVLLPGINQIQVQSEDGTGNYVLDEITANYAPAGYSGPQISQLNISLNVLKRYERTDITFDVETVADNIFFPYDTMSLQNMNTGSGIHVDMIFTNGEQTLIQPAFLHMAYNRIDDRLVPSGVYNWKVRMAFRQSGTWTSTIVARDAGGETQVSGPMIEVTDDWENRGFLRVSESDNRYFEYENGEPFLAMGHGTSAAGPAQTDEETGNWQQNNLNFGRFWLSSVSPFSDPWSSWATHHQMENNGYMPPPLLTYNQKYGNGQFSYRIASPAIENVNTPAIFRGFWDGKTAVEPGKTYRIIARVKTVDVNGPGGLVVKTGGWLGTDVVNPGVGQVITPYMRGDNHWSYLVGTLQTGSGQTSLDNIYLVLENCTGEAYLDQLTIQEVNPDGSLMQNILTKWNANTHLYLDPIRPKNADYKIEQANNAGIHYKIVIHEKEDYISNHIDQAGFVSPLHGNFNQPPGSPLHRVYEYYWRNLIARWGYATSVHSWELVNEGAPGSYFNLLDNLSNYFAQHSPNPRMVSTSFWSNWEPDFWAESLADYGDIHAYIMTTGWIDNITIDGVEYSREDLRNDAAAAVYAYSVTVGTDPLRNKPVVWGETDLDMHGSQSPDTLLAQDTDGVWLHNFNWAHINHGGVTGLIWDTQNIRNNDLYERYRVFHHFMKNIPITEGQYQQAIATSTNTNIRVWGQMQASGNAAHIWIQNRNHTWRNVLTNGLPSPESATITLSGLAPGAHVLSEWDPWGQDTVAKAVDTVWVNESGMLQVAVNGLIRDIAYQVLHTEPGEISDPGYHWPQHQRDAARTGRTELSIPPPYRARWIWAGPQLTLRNQESEPGWTDDLTTRDGYSYPIPDTLNFTISGSVQAVIYGSRLYFATMDGDAYALNMHDGETLWSAPMPGGSTVSAAVVDDVVVFAGVRGTVMAFDTLSGHLQWQHQTGGAITTAPCISGNSVLIANHRGNVFRIHASGTVMWETTLPAPVAGGIAAHGNTLYVPAEDMVVYALNLSNGSINASQQVRGQSFRLCHPVVHNGRVWVTSVTVPMVGSEYIMEEVMAASSTLEEEEQNIRLWLQGNNNNGAWPYASEDWQHFFALDAVTLENLFLIPAGPVDGCGYPAPAPAIDNQGRVLRWWKTRFPFLTAEGPAFGTNFTLDIAGTDPNTGNRIPIDNGQLSNMWPLETDNLYAFSVGGEYLWMRQNFRGTQVINLNTSQHILAQVTTRYSDGGDFVHAHVCYRNTNLPNEYYEVPYITTQMRTAGRMAPSIAGNYVFITEEFAIVAIEHHSP